VTKNGSGEDKLEDLLRHKLKVVFCGTAAGTVSAERGQYYVGPGNKFWETLYKIGLTKRKMDPGEYWDVMSEGIGFTDLVKGKSGMDKVLEESDFKEGRKRLRREIEKYQPRVLCFNGKRAAKEYFGVKRVEYGLQEERIGETRVFVAPSTSAAARRWWDCEFWEELADLVNEI
jgi:TDG/mug DNA glycosylase family protein